MGVGDRIIRRRRQWPHVAPLVDTRENDKIAARDLLAGPPRGGPVLADRNYFAFARCAAPDGAGRWYISRLRAGTSRAVRLVQCRHDGTRYRRITNAPASTTERRTPWSPGTARTRPPRHAGRHCGPRTPQASIRDKLA